MIEGWIYFVLLIISIIVQIALAPKPVIPDAATIGDFEFPQYEEGTPQSVIFGDVIIKGWQVLTYGEFRTQAIEKSGGKK